LFRPFTRLDSLPDILEAYGAEMTAVHLIAATHEATVAVQGLAGQGTTFEICFPLVREPEETARNCVP
jgi:light-regulated signal transduction histidine kinase (bacteriophytochrome)